MRHAKRAVTENTYAEPYQTDLNYSKNFIFPPLTPDLAQLRDIAPPFLCRNSVNYLAKS